MHDVTTLMWSAFGFLVGGTTVLWAVVVSRQAWEEIRRGLRARGFPTRFRF
jgi:hypothetical protein